MKPSQQNQNGRAGRKCRDCGAPAQTPLKHRVGGWSRDLCIACDEARVRFLNKQFANLAKRSESNEQRS